MKTSVQNTQNELGILDLFKILLSKIKVIICVTLIAAIVGAAIGACITMFGKRDFAARVEFYVNPGSADSQVLHLLSSERFAEKLLLDENGLPYNGSGEDYDAALAAKLEYNAALKELADAKKAAEEAPRELAVIQKAYEEKQKAYDEACNLLSIYQRASDELAKLDDHKDKKKDYEARVTATTVEKETAEKAYYEASQNTLSINNRLEAAKENLKNTKNTSDDLAEIVLAEWRAKDGNKKKISNINNAITYEYVEFKEPAGQAAADSSRQFISVSIVVANDEVLAKTLLDGICEILPTYIEETSTNLDFEKEVDCTLISTAAEVEDLARNSLVKEIIKYAAIASIGVLAITCILVLLTGSKNAKLREEEIEEIEKVEESEF